jgi:hypothetical protein
VDGLPLAIELATGRINLFSPGALRDRLKSRLQLLGSGAQDLPARQQTLRSTIEWSYQLLEPGEQRLFELLSVFSGTSFDAAEAVVGSVDVLRGTEVGTLDALASLMDKSLIRPADATAGEPRLVMLETIREYAAERLDDLPDFAASARRAHAVYFADFARREWEHLTGDERDTALAAIAAEIENLRLAWRYWVAERDLEQLNRLVDSLWFIYETKGLYQATIELTTELLDVLSSTPSTPERAMQEVTLRTSLARALMAISGYTQEVEDEYTRALELFEGERELPELFPVLRGQGDRLFRVRGSGAPSLPARQQPRRRLLDDVGLRAVDAWVPGPGTRARDARRRPGDRAGAPLHTRLGALPYRLSSLVETRAGADPGPRRRNV